MNARRTHPAICLIALAAYLLNLGAAAGGAVFCQEPAGDSSIEFACDHDHCAATPKAHDHDVGGCWCSSCPCEDTSLAIDVAPSLRDDDVGVSTLSSITVGFLQQFETQRRSTNRALLADRPPPVLDQSLRQLRTVILIV